MYETAPEIVDFNPRGRTQDIAPEIVDFNPKRGTQDIAPEIVDFNPRGRTQDFAPEIVDFNPKGEMKTRYSNSKYKMGLNLSIDDDNSSDENEIAFRPSAFKPPPRSQQTDFYFRGVQTSTRGGGFGRGGFGRRQAFNCEKNYGDDDYDYNTEYGDELTGGNDHNMGDEDDVDIGCLSHAKNSSHNQDKEEIAFLSAYGMLESTYYNVSSLIYESCFFII